MATIAEKRTWLRDQGHEPPARGPLPPHLNTLAEEALAPEPDLDWDLGDDDVPAIDPDDLEPSVPMQPERPPRSPRAARAERRTQPVGQRTGRLLGALRGEPKAKPAAGRKPKAPPRTSLEKFTTRAYTSLGRMLGALSPATGNCLQAQAAMAGVILEDTVRGTVVDRILQPAARAEDKLDKIGALVLPPVVVFAMEQNRSAVAMGVKSPQAGMMREAMLMPVLRESLRIGLEVSEAYADQIKARLEKNAETEGEIDKLIALIFGQVTAEAEDVPEPEMAGATA
jgi:hypothetical protein